MKQIATIIMIMMGLTVMVSAKAEEVNCSKQQQKQNQLCYKQYNQDQSDYNKRTDRMDVENQRHNKAIKACRQKWTMYRDKMHQRYLQQNNQCSNGDCRNNALNGYNLLFNTASLMEMNCVEAENATHEENTDKIHSDYPNIDFYSHNPPYDNYKQCKQEAQDEYNICVENQSNNNNQGSYNVEGCPPGTQPNVLGICTKNFSLAHYGQASTQNNGCGPGMVRGHDDGCIPKITGLGVYHDGSSWWLICPKGTRPSPIDGGCIFAPDPTTAGSQDNDIIPRCPPGTSPGADDKCVPDWQQQLGLEGGALVLPNDVMTPYLGEEVNYDGVSQYAMPVEDPAAAIEQTRQALGAEDNPY